MNEALSKIIDKGHQAIAFFRHTTTPLSLTLDCFKMKRHPYVAETNGGLKLALLPNVGDGFTFFENIIRRDYLQGGIALDAGATVVDIGANIGAFSVLAGSIVGPSGRVIAFEPSAKTFDRLEENVALNQLHNVHCCRAAIDAQDGTVTLHVPAKSAYARLDPVGIESEDRNLEQVPCMTLASAIARFDIDRINLLKLDCEGSEYSIIESLSPQLASRIDQIAMELHLTRGRAGADRLREQLEAFGFDVQVGLNWFATRR